MTDRHAQKDALLLAALEHVAFDGWSRQALAAAARDLELEPTTARRLFPRGGESMLDAFDDWADRQMLARLENEDLERLRVRDRIAAAVRARVEALAPYREATRRALSARSLPNTAMGGFQNLWRTVDRMWLAAGDSKSDGLAVYTKRAMLAAIYTATVLYWLEDTSLDQEDTWDFLDRRIDDVMRLQSWRERAQRASRRLPFRRRPYWTEEANV
ncbi:MAG: COQ9 family protein [Alphaproteobacteria bacterium]|jgi:ubiquinone biosynthesis protein COQ9|nr:COQ9 family protein [Alphaproteobacteria bacterium]